MGNGIVKRGDRYGVRLYNPATRRYDWIGTYASEDEALQAKLNAKRAPARAGTETCAQFADRWLIDHNRVSQGSPRWGEKTLRDMRYALRPFTKRFGAVPLREFDISQARPWAVKQPDRYLAVARAMFADAVSDGLAPTNPFANLRISKSRGRKDIVAVTEPELETLIGLAEKEGGQTFAAMVATAGYVGLRGGEIFALEPLDVDLASKTVTVRQAFNGVELKRPKNDRPRRVLLPDEAASRIQAMPRPLHGRWLFQQPRGGQFTKGTLFYYWKATRSAFEAQLDERRARQLRDSRNGKAFAFHELRHAAATIVLRRGGTAELAAHQLGHTDKGRLIQQRYGHLEDDYTLDRLRAVFDQNVKPILRLPDADASEGRGR